MSIDVMNSVWKKSKYAGGKLMLLLAIADYANEDKGGCAWPSTVTLAKKIRMSVRQVKRLIKEIEQDRDELAVIWGGNGPRDTNRFFVLTGFDPVKKADIWKYIDEVNKKKAETQLTSSQKKSDILSPLEKGVISSKEGDILGVRVTSRVKKGDMAVSPDPLLTVTLNPQEPLVITKAVCASAQNPPTDPVGVVAKTAPEGESEIAQGVGKASSEKTGERPGAEIAPPGNGNKPESKKRERDLIWESLAVVCGIIPPGMDFAKTVDGFKAAIKAGVAPPVLDWSSVDKTNKGMLNRYAADLRTHHAKPCDLFDFLDWKTKVKQYKGILRPGYVVQDWYAFLHRNDQLAAPYLSPAERAGQAALQRGRN